MKAKKKKRQDDFQKVKLKVGKKKPRADNATNTTFRTRGIHLTEQLKTDTSGPTTHRQLGINVGFIRPVRFLSSAVWPLTRVPSSACCRTCCLSFTITTPP